MLDEIRKGLFAGFGAVVLTREKIEAVCRKLVEEAKMSKEDAEKLANDLYDAGRRQWSDLEGWIRNAVRSALESIDVGSDKELKKIAAKLDNVEKRVTLLESVGRLPQRKEGTSFE